VLVSYIIIFKNPVILRDIAQADWVLEGQA